MVSERDSRSRAFWWLAALLIAALPALPIGVVLASWLMPAGDAGQHVLEYVLLRVSVNTVWMTTLVAGLSALLGVSLAWLTANCEFAGRRFFNWTLLLPLAFPAYVMAVALADVFGFNGVAHGSLRTLISDELPWLALHPGLASASCLSLSLYPYVYLLSRQAFSSQGLNTFEAAQSLGCSPSAAFFEVSLPMARPWIVGGLSLVVMETLADFGTVQIFNFDTLTSAIYTAWFGLFSLPAALQLASALLLLVVLAVLLERHARGRRAFSGTNERQRVRRISLKGRQAFFATLACSFVFALAFVVPLTRLAYNAVRSLDQELSSEYFAYVWHSLSLSGLTAFALLALGLVLALSGRALGTGAARGLQRFATLGYALPGTVLAVGFFVPVAGLGHVLSAGFSSISGENVSVVLTGGLLTLLLALCTRYLAVAFQPVENGLLKVTPNMEDAARGLGSSGIDLVRRVHWPLLRPALATAMLLVFVDVMKELPITLMTRPFGWDTLAVRVFQMTTEGEWERAALPSISIVLVGLLPLWIINKRSAQHA